MKLTPHISKQWNHEAFDAKNIVENEKKRQFSSAFPKSESEKFGFSEQKQNIQEYEEYSELQQVMTDRSQCFSLKNSLLPTRSYPIQQFDFNYSVFNPVPFYSAFENCT